MFDTETSSSLNINFNPMRDVWFPLDLSNAASFYGIMAHSAAHLAYLQGQKDAVEVLRYKSEAVSLINQWMQNEKTALDDATFAAVVRLLTFEVGRVYYFSKFSVADDLLEILGHGGCLAHSPRWTG